MPGSPISAILLNTKSTQKGEGEMKFGDFLKSCREKSGMTQENLVHALYLFDDTLFHGLDTTTLSKWERAITQPKAPKQIRILEFFQKEHGKVLPCFDRYSVPENEKRICKLGVKNLIIGKKKDLVLNFPTKMMTLDNLSITHARYLDNMEIFLEVASDLRNSVQPPYTQISEPQLQEWALHPSNLFLVCQYKGFIIGLLFVLRLKPEIQRKILHFKKAFSELTPDDFASFEEDGALITTHFFAWNHKSATLLIIRYYAHLIANQHNIESVGATVYYEEGKEILANMNLHPVDRFIQEDIEITAYHESLDKILLNENVMKMLFRKTECPEE
jgi:transcriptional regulator with XRE-family HTH domain